MEAREPPLVRRNTRKDGPNRAKSQQKCYAAYLSFLIPCLLLFLLVVDTWTVTFSPDSKYIATGSHSGKVNLVGVESGQKEETLDTRSKFTMSIAYVGELVLLIDLWTSSCNLLRGNSMSRTLPFRHLRSVSKLNIT